MSKVTHSIFTQLLIIRSRTLNKDHQIVDTTLEELIAVTVFRTDINKYGGAKSEIISPKP